MTVLLVTFVGVNVIAFLAFGWDKHCAVSGQRRVSEATLLRLALFGGAAGAIAGQSFFRHKTRKEPFRSSLYLMAAINVTALAALSVPEVRMLLREAIAWDL